MSTEIERAVRDFILTLDAVTAMVPATSIKPDELLQTDPLVSIAIEVIEKNYDNDLSGTASLVGAVVVVTSSSTDKSEAQQIADAIQTNGTDPGTGMAGCTVTTGFLPFQAMLMKQTFDRLLLPAGANVSRRIVDSQYTLTFNQTT